MSYINQDILKSFYTENSWLTKAGNLTNVASIITQIDNIIYQKTKVATPAEPANAIPTLQNIACCYFIWFTTGIQGKIDEMEYKRRRELFNDAKKMLNEISAGDMPIYDSEGTQVNIDNSTQATFVSTKRHTSMP